MLATVGIVRTSCQASAFVSVAKAWCTAVFTLSRAKAAGHVLNTEQLQAGPRARMTLLLTVTAKAVATVVVVVHIYMYIALA